MPHVGETLLQANLQIPCHNYGMILGCGDVDHIMKRS